MADLLRILADVLAPVFLLVAAGALLSSRRPVDTTTLAALAYWVLGPAFVFDLIVGAEIDRDLVVRLAVAGLAGMAAAGGIAALTTRSIGASRSVTAAATMTAAYGNVGNTGLAVSAFAFGDEVLPIATVLMLVVNVTGIALGVTLASSRDRSPLLAVAAGLRAPMTLAVIPAVLVNVADIDPPLLVSRPAGLLSAALIPVMLLSLGAQLHRTGLRRPAPDVGVSIAAKLIAAPLAAWMVARWLGLDDEALGVVVIQSAMPAAVFTSVVAVQEDLEPERVTATLVLGTIVSVPSLLFVVAAVT